MNINGLIGSLQSGVAQGVLWGIMVLGVYITYKLLDIADLTVDGSFTLGGCVTTVAILAGIHPVPATLMGWGPVSWPEPSPASCTPFSTYRPSWPEF